MPDMLGRQTSLSEMPDVEELLNAHEIRLGPLIGEGQFAKVFCGKYCGDLFAVKKQFAAKEDPHATAAPVLLCR